MQLKLAISSGMGGMSAKHQQEPLAPENTPAPKAPWTEKHQLHQKITTGQTRTLDTGQTRTSCTTSNMVIGQTGTSFTRGSQQQQHHRLQRQPLCIMTNYVIAHTSIWKLLCDEHVTSDMFERRWGRVLNRFAQLQD